MSRAFTTNSLKNKLAAAYNQRSKAEYQRIFSAGAWTSVTIMLIVSAYMLQIKIVNGAAAISGAIVLYQIYQLVVAITRWSNTPSYRVLEQMLRDEYGGKELLAKADNIAMAKQALGRLINVRQDLDTVRDNWTDTTGLGSVKRADVLEAELFEMSRALTTTAEQLLGHFWAAERKLCEQQQAYLKTLLDADGGINTASKNNAQQAADLIDQIATHY